jgi:small GTP-binding protein
LTETSSGHKTPGLAFHPIAPVLATLGEKDTVIRIWDLDCATILSMPPITPVIHYANAKVVLVGDSGVGKSGLGLVLAGQSFAPTESTHSRSVWTLSSVNLKAGRKETRETLLWDLAGQPGYRLIHQLHLNEVVVALVVFDARSETDPFAGVQHWDRALRQAQFVQGNTMSSLKKYLVAARTDRGGIGVSLERIQSLIQNLNFDGYFETSAKEGTQVEALKKAIQKAIDWDKLPKISSTLLFHDIKAFLVAEKEAGHVLSTTDDLYRLFFSGKHARIEAVDLLAQFAACIGRVESAGLIQQLSFGNFVLLQPELLDVYASALINAVKDEPDGLGSIAEERVRAGNFRIPEDKRLKDKEQEKLLLIAIVEDLLRHELVLREEPFLVFPSQSTRENTDLPDPEGKSVVFEFEGPVLNFYTTLVVRLSHSGLFKKKELWKNAVTFTANLGGVCGMFLRNIDEGHGELTLFFDQTANKETQRYFEEYVYLHLQRRVPPNALKRRRVIVCQECGWIVTDQTFQLLMKRRATELNCPICTERISLLDTDSLARTASSQNVLDMDRIADRRRDQEAAKSTLQGKKETRDFDVFLCYHSIDLQTVEQIGRQLQDLGYLPWLDQWELPPGRPWQRLLEKQMRQIKSVAVFVGKGGNGPWQQFEIEAFLREFVRRDCPVIPVHLADAPKKPKLPLFLEGMTWVDFRKQDLDPMEHLIWGITGKRSFVKEAFRDPY